MSTAIAPTTTIKDVRAELDSMNLQFKAALPKHIPAERFIRVVMTAVQNNPKLLKCERRSLFNACMKAAQDGLLPDGREGAIIDFNDKDRGLTAQWMPMIAGIRKKVRNSGEIATWDTNVVHENDEFYYELGDNAVIRHKPTLDEPGRVIAAYSVAVLKSGERSREVMSIAAIEKVRKRSRARSGGPWFSDYEEMCRKTVARRHSKQLPMSSDLDDLIRRDDGLYDMEGGSDKNQLSDQRRGLGSKLELIANDKLPAAEEKPAARNAQAGKATPRQEQDAADDEDRSEQPSELSSTASSAAVPQDDDDDGNLTLEEYLGKAAERGTADRKAGKAKKVPKAYSKGEAEAYVAAYDEEDANHGDD